MALKGELGKIFLSLELQLAKFTDGLNKAERLAQQRSQRIGRAFDVAKKAALALGAAVGTIAIGRMITESVRAADEIGKLSQRLGIGVKALSEFQVIADLTGVSFNTLTTGLQRQTRRLAEANQGTGEAVKALKELNLTASDLFKLSPDKQFGAIADAILKIKDPADQVRLAMKLWDSEGVALLQTVKQLGGSQGLQQLQGELERLGISLDEDTAKKAAEARDQMTLLNAQIEALIRELAINFAEPAGKVIQWLRDMIPLLKQSAEGWAFLFEKVADFISITDEEVFAAQQEQLRAQVKQFTALRAKVAEGTRAYEFFTERIEAAREQLNANNQAMLDSLEAAEEVKKQVEQTTEAEAGLAEAVEKTVEPIKKQTKALTDKHPAFAQVNKDIEALIQNEELFGRKAVELSDEFKTALEQVDTELQAATGRWQNLFEDFERSVFESWVDFWEGLLDGSVDSFKDFVNAVFDQFKSLVARMVAVWTSQKFFEFLGIGGDGGGFTLGNVSGGANLARGGAGLLKLGGGTVGLKTLFGGAFGSGGAAAGIEGAGLIPQVQKLGALGKGGGFSFGTYAGPLAMLAAVHGIGRLTQKESAAEDFAKVVQRGGLREIAPGITGGSGRRGFLFGIGEREAEKLVGLVGAYDEVNDRISVFNDGIVTSKEYYDQLVQVIEDGAGTIIGSQENIEKRAKAAMDRMSDDTLAAFRAIETSSEQVSDAMRDGFVSAAELSALGLHGLSGMAASVFQSIIDNARAAATAAAQVGEAVGGPAPRFGPVPRITAPPRGRDYDIGDFAAQHGGTFQVTGSGGIDQNAIRVTRGERVTVETPGQAGKQIELLGAILAQLQRQSLDLSRIMARA